MRLARASLAVAGASCVVAAACSVYDATLLTSSVVDAGIVDAGTADTALACDPAVPPARPSLGDGGGPSGQEVMFALESLDLGVDGSDAGVVGYDLDQACTCPGAGSCLSSAPRCDDERGRDNAVGELIRQFASLTAVLSPADVTKRIHDGDDGILLAVRDLGDLENDSQVTLSVFVSAGLQIFGGPYAQHPKHDGTDRWFVDSSSIDAPTSGVISPRRDHQDKSAYVTGGELVANVQLLSLHLVTRSGAPPIRFDMTNAVLTARLARRDSGVLALEDGVIAGRLPTAGFLTALAAFRDPLSPGSYLCGSDQTYQDIRSTICAARDVNADSRNDGKGAPCDSLSFAFRFTATEALFGPVATPPADPRNCGPAYADDCAN